jgi:hypothetical protein
MYLGTAFRFVNATKIDDIVASLIRCLFGAPELTKEQKKGQGSMKGSALACCFLFLLLKTLFFYLPTICCMSYANSPIRGKPHTNWAVDIAWPHMTIPLTMLIGSSSSSKSFLPTKGSQEADVLICRETTLASGTEDDEAEEAAEGEAAGEAAGEAEGEAEGDAMVVVAVAEEGEDLAVKLCGSLFALLPPPMVNNLRVAAPIIPPRPMAAVIHNCKVGVLKIRSPYVTSSSNVAAISSNSNSGSHINTNESYPVLSGISHVSALPFFCSDSSSSTNTSVDVPSTNSMELTNKNMAWDNDRWLFSTTFFGIRLFDDWRGAGVNVLPFSSPYWGVRVLRDAAPSGVVVVGGVVGVGSSVSQTVHLAFEDALMSVQAGHTTPSMAGDEGGEGEGEGERAVGGACRGVVGEVEGAFGAVVDVAGAEDNGDNPFIGLTSGPKQ